MQYGAMEGCGESGESATQMGWWRLEIRHEGFHREYPTQYEAMEYCLEVSVTQIFGKAGDIKLLVLAAAAPMEGCDGTSALRLADTTGSHLLCRQAFVDFHNKAMLYHRSFRFVQDYLLRTWLLQTTEHC